MFYDHFILVMDLPPLSIKSPKKNCT